MHRFYIPPSLREYKIFKSLRTEFIEYAKKDVIVFGLAHMGAQAELAVRLIPYAPWIFLEDGISSYSMENQVELSRYLDSVNAVAMVTTDTFGALTLPNIVDINIKIDKAWANLSDSYKGRIIALFDVENIEFEKIEEVVFLQPLYGKIDVSKHIQIYQALISKHKNAYIKPHPRDELDYSNVISKDKIIPRDAPAELLKLLGLKPKKVITLFSSAVFFYPDAEIVWYGPHLEELKSIYGNLEDIYIPNAKLD